jgi:hypothetical protein
MLHRLPPRFHVFILTMLNGLLGGVAAIGILATYNDGLSNLAWGVLIAFGIGSAVRALTRDVPPEILAAHQSAKLER